MQIIMLPSNGHYARENKVIRGDNGDQVGGTKYEHQGNGMGNNQDGNESHMTCFHFSNVYILFIMLTTNIFAPQIYY